MASISPAAAVQDKESLEGMAATLLNRVINVWFVNYGIKGSKLFAVGELGDIFTCGRNDLPLRTILKSSPSSKRRKWIEVEGLSDFSFSFTPS